MKIGMLSSLVNIHLTPLHFEIKKINVEYAVLKDHIDFWDFDRGVHLVDAVLSLI